MTQIHLCAEFQDAVALYPVLGLYLKPIARINITIHYPSLKQSLTTGATKSVSSWEVMEKIKGLVAPDNFISLKVVKNTLEFIRFEGDLETRSVLKTIVTRLDNRSLKLTGFKELLKIRAAETKVPFPSKYDWDSFFRDNSRMNEMKAGERPDTIHFQCLPSKWFSDKKSAEKPVPSEKIFRRVWETFGEVRCIDIPVLDPYRPQMQSAIAGIKTFTFSQDPVFEAYVQYKDYLSFVKAMDALRGSFLLYQEDNKAWVASIRVNFDKTKHLCDESIRRRRIERERLAELERRREAPKIIKTPESIEASTKKDLSDDTTSKQDSGRVELKIAMEERKYMIARRKLEAIRLLDYLFQRIKKQRENDMRQIVGSTSPPKEEEYGNRRRSDHPSSSHSSNKNNLTGTIRRRSVLKVESDSTYSRDKGPYSDEDDEGPAMTKSPPRNLIHQNDMHRRSPRLHYMNDWEMLQHQNREVGYNNYFERPPFEHRGGHGGRTRGTFRGRVGRVMRYSRGFRQYHSQPFYDGYKHNNNSVSLTEAYDHAYEKYFNSISRRHDRLNNSADSQDGIGDDDYSRQYDSGSRSRSRSRSVSYPRS